VVWLICAVLLAGKVASVWIGWSSPGTALALWFVPDLLLVHQVLAPNAQGFMRVHRRFRAAGREVWLTIDDGPDPEDTPRILALLAAHGARATFFVIGEKAVRHPDLIRAIVAGGHEIGHHTHTHPLATFWYAGPARVAAELDRLLAALAELGVRPARFRPPAGVRNWWLPGALLRRRLACIGWSGRGLERTARDPAGVERRVLRRLAPGAIFLLHEGPRVPAAIRVEGIRRVLAQLYARGYRCVVPDAAQLAGEGRG
jgi:peptidoglycan/xylan/chitin deacetylase (PgdA/CDA1 family)